MKQRTLFNQSGVSLIELLITVGLLSIVITGTVSAIIWQQRETKALTEKLTILDFERMAIGALGDGSTCEHILNHPTRQTFDATALSAGPVFLTPSLPLYANVRSGIPGPILAQAGEAIDAKSPSLIVESVRLRIDSGQNSTYRGAWEIHLRPDSLVRSLKPISISTLLEVDATQPTAAAIIGCQGGRVTIGNKSAHTFCATPAEGVVLKTSAPYRICTLSAVDDDVGSTTVSTDYKCRVAEIGGAWRGYALLGCGAVACAAHCFDIL